MTPIKRAYWNKHTPECTKSPDDSWVKTRIEGHDYYGRSLKGKHFEKFKIVVGKIIPLFALSIAFAPISIPVLFAMGKYRKLGISIREVHYDTKIKYLLNSNTVPFSAHADNNLISKILLEPDLADSYEAAQYISLLSQVSKSFAPLVKETTKALVTSGKLRLKDIPEILTKDDALNYIQSWDDLIHLDLSGFDDLDDQDITFIVDKWPNLKTLIVRSSKISNHSVDEINKLTELDRLFLINHLGFGVDQFPILNDNLKDFSFKGSFQDYPKQWPNLKKLNLSVNTHLLPLLDQLSELKELTLAMRGIGGRADYSTINQMTQLEKLDLGFLTKSTNCSFDGWTDLKELSLQGTFNSIPSIDHLTKLETLSINSPFIADLGSSLDQMSSLKKLNLDCHLTDFPNLDALINLKELTIRLFSDDSNLPDLDSLTHLEKLAIYTRDADSLPPNYLDQLVNLKELTIQGGAAGLTVPGDFFNQLIHLKYLNLYQVNGFDPLPSTVKVTNSYRNLEFICLFPNL